MAGYSKTSLLKKLGIKEGFLLYTIGEPDNYRDLLGVMPPTASFVNDAYAGKVDFIHIFCKDQHFLKANFLLCKAMLASDGILWVSWPKKASKVPTDLSDEVVRTIGLEGGLVDVKVCAVDEIWSGLKFVYRVSDR